jgi:hypothetical protein
MRFIDYYILPLEFVKVAETEAASLKGSEADVKFVWLKLILEDVLSMFLPSD